jgi:hypothetical protein
MFDERFARQYRYEPPSGFPLTSPYTGKVHHLSGPNRYALAQSSGYSLMSACAAVLLGTFHLRFAYRFITSTLAYMLDSLVRVSRRDGGDHCHRIVRRPLKPTAASLNARRVNPTERWLIVARDFILCFNCPFTIFKHQTSAACL